MLQHIEKLISRSKTLFTRSEILARAMLACKPEKIRRLKANFEEITACLLDTRKKLPNENKDQAWLDFIYHYACQEFQYLTANDLLNWAIQCNQQPFELYKHLENGADINGQDCNEWYAMDIAVLYGRRAHINFLLTNGVSTHRFGRTTSWHPVPLLHHASRQKHFC